MLGFDDGDRHEHVMAMAALITPGLLVANGMQEFPYLAKMAVEIALAIEAEVLKQVPEQEPKMFHDPIRGTFERATTDRTAE